jgi:hypothetical protein
MSYLRHIVLAIALFYTGSGFAQVSVQFIPEIFGRNIDGLMNATLINLQQRRSVRLKITVAEAKAGQVLVLQTQPFDLVPGHNILPSAIIRSAKIGMAANKVGNYIRQNQSLPAGNYEYTFDVISAISHEEVIVDQVFSQEITPPAPLDLIEPFNEDKICEKRPILTWQPALPLVAGQLYGLTLVEVKDKQNPVEALNYNLPIVNQKGIIANVLMYPPISKELTEGKKYAWQVTAYKDQTVINRSEVWSFTVDCKDSVSNTIETDNGYRDLEDLLKGNFYVATGSIKFMIINSYAPQKLKYSITCITDPEQKIRALPKKKLINGKNKINLDLSHNFSFKDGYSYLLHVEMPNGKNQTLRFIYKDLE